MLRVRWVPGMSGNVVLEWECFSFLVRLSRDTSLPECVCLLPWEGELHFVQIYYFALGCSLW